MAGIAKEFSDFTADMTGQAHVFIHPNRIAGSPQQDTRSIDVINRDGPDARFLALDSIHPLAQTVLHEVSACIILHHVGRSLLTIDVVGSCRWWL
jgi:hypothetical protein